MERDLGLFEDEDGILRCNGQICNTEISKISSAGPAVPKNCVLVDGLVRSSHKSRVSAVFYKLLQGANSHGQLCNGNKDDVLEPSVIQIPHPSIKYVTGGGGHTAVVTGNNSFLNFVIKYNVYKTICKPYSPSVFTSTPFNLH